MYKGFFCKKIVQNSFNKEMNILRNIYKNKCNKFLSFH